MPLVPRDASGLGRSLPPFHHTPFTTCPFTTTPLPHPSFTTRPFVTTHLHHTLPFTTHLLSPPLHHTHSPHPSIHHTSPFTSPSPHISFHLPFTTPLHHTPSPHPLHISPSSARQEMTSAPPPSVNRMTDRCKNSTFPQLCLWVVIISNCTKLNQYESIFSKF